LKYDGIYIKILIGLEWLRFQNPYTLGIKSCSMKSSLNNSSAFFEFTPNRATIKKSATDSILIQVILKMKGIITMPILTSLMMPSEMGIFNIILVTASVITPLFTLNLPDGSVLFFSREKSLEKIQTMYMTVLNTVGLITLVLTLIMGLLILIFRRDLLPSALWVFLVLFGTIFYKLAEFIFAIYQKTRILLGNAFIRDLGVSVFGVVLVAIGLSYKGLVIANSTVIVVMGLVLFRIVFKYFSYSRKISISYLKTFLKMSIPLLPVFFFSWVIRSSDSYFLMHFMGENVVGKYSVVYGLCNIILVFTYALNYFWFPVSSRLWIENREKYRQAFKSAFSAFVSVLFVAVLMFELNSKIIMKILARKADYQDAFIIVGIIAFAFALQVLITLLTAPLYANKNQNIILFCYLSGALLNAVLNFLLIPRYGLSGAAISTAVSYLLIVSTMSFFNYKIAKFSFLDKRIVYAIAFFSILWAGCAYLRNQLNAFQTMFSSFVIISIISILLYFVVLKEDEKRFIIEIVRAFSLKRA